MQNITSIKQRFGIIGNSTLLNRAIEIASQVAATDLSVLVTGESGTGKEIMPQIIHNLSSRKHGPYIAVNCGAIPEGTIDSELFGHEKGSFTGAHEARKGYFEVANTGTIFLDEVAELPLATQSRLLRVLESGEYMRVGSSKVMKTDVRIIAATNVNIPEAIRKGKFREDLYYRLNTVPIFIPALRERKEDIILLFRKFASDFAEKYRMPAVRLDEEATQILLNFSWPGNIRQLKNITEQISVIEQEREIRSNELLQYLPKENTGLPAISGNLGAGGDLNEREILYKIIFEMRSELNDLKSVVMELLQNRSPEISGNENAGLLQRLYSGENEPVISTGDSQIIRSNPINPMVHASTPRYPDDIAEHVEVEESLSLEEKEKDLIKKALHKHRNKRKYAAKELGISERTLYRKIKEYNIK
ncbi:MAG: sigma-54 interaction domain-containing protein [Flavobacteriales bacterium]